MENETTGRKSRGLSTVLIAILFFIIGGVAAYYGTKTIEKFNSKKDIKTEVTTPEVYVSTFDVVAQRRAEIQSHKTDSIYYSIPESSFIEIVDLLGSNTTHAAVVNQYTKLKSYYIGIERGAKTERLKQDTLTSTKPPIIKNVPVVPE